MSVTVRIPTQLRTLTGGAGEVEVEGATVGEVLKAVDAAHPGLADRLFDEAGNLRRFVNVFLADEDVRFLDGLATPVTPGQTLSVVPAVAVALVPPDHAQLHAAIATRFDAMLDAGLVDELLLLRQRFALDPAMPSMRCVGYRQAWQFQEGTIDARALRATGIASPWVTTVSAMLSRNAASSSTIRIRAMGFPG